MRSDYNGAREEEDIEFNSLSQCSLRISPIEGTSQIAQHTKLYSKQYGHLKCGVEVTGSRLKMINRLDNGEYPNRKKHTKVGLTVLILYNYE